jgi:hypothetical protein
LFSDQLAYRKSIEPQGVTDIFYQKSTIDSCYNQMTFRFFATDFSHQLSHSRFLTADFQGIYSSTKHTRSMFWSRSVFWNLSLFVRGREISTRFGAGSEEVLEASLFSLFVRGILVFVSAGSLDPME